MIDEAVKGYNESVIKLGKNDLNAL